MRVMLGPFGDRRFSIPDQFGDLSRHARLHRCCVRRVALVVTLCAFAPSADKFPSNIS